MGGAGGRRWGPEGPAGQSTAGRVLRGALPPPGTPRALLPRGDVPRHCRACLALSHQWVPSVLALIASVAALLLGDRVLTVSAALVPVVRADGVTRDPTS